MTACAGARDIQPGAPGLDHAAGVVLDVVGGVGVGAVGDDLHQRLAATLGQALLEILRNHHVAAQVAGDQLVGHFAPVMGEVGIQEARAGKGRRKLLRCSAGRLQHHADTDILRIQRHRIGEQQQQHHRQHERDQQRRGVAQRLVAFLGDQGDEAPQVKTAQIDLRGATPSLCIVAPFMWRPPARGRPTPPGE
jgi:hypothetical protein